MFRLSFGKRPSIADQVASSLKNQEEKAVKGTRRSSTADAVSNSLKNPIEFCDEEEIKPTNSDEELKRKLAAEQMSSFLKNPAEFAEPEVIEPVPQKSDSKEETEKESNSKHSDSPTKSQDGLPSLEECLYGAAAGMGPFIPTDDDPSDNGEDSATNALIDDGLNSRWSQEESNVSTYYHDIDIAVLRKLCSHGSGIPEEETPRGEEGGSTRGTCHRGVAWRVLLELLPVRDIHTIWPKSVPPQRTLYRELVEKYMEDAIDPGSCLKGESHWEQSLRMNSENSSINGTDEKTKPKTRELDSSAHIRATEDIYDVFPLDSKYRELWRKAGITLNQGESAAAIRMNRLRVPQELLSEDTADDREPDESEHNVDADDTDDDEKPDTSENKDSTEKDASNESRKDDLFEQFCKDAKLLSEIRKDVVRTNPHLRFYLETRNRLGIRRHAALERVLFVWAKLNGNLYVQGMNEIVGTIYYVLAMDPTASSGSSSDSLTQKYHFWADNAEADTYFLFNSLLNTMEVRDVFVASLDHNSISGLHARIKNIEMLLKEHDPEIFNHLKVLGLDSSFYAIRWLTTLLSREFRLPDTIRLWDSMLASTHKENFLRYVCASMVMAVRDRLLRGDFGTCLKLLQNYPSGEIGMDELLESSRALWVYEMQISVACQKGGIPLRQALNMVSPPESVIMAFGRPGGKPLKLTQQLRNVASPIVASTTVAANQNVGKIMGQAKRLWNWRTPPKTEKKITNVDKVDLSKLSDPRMNATKDANCDVEEEWDLIDSILDGKTEFVAGSMRSSSSISDSSGVPPKRETSIDSNLTTPTSSPTKSRPTGSFDDDDDIVEDFSNNDSSFDQEDHIAASTNTNSGMWNRIKRSY